MLVFMLIQTCFPVLQSPDSVGFNRSSNLMPNSSVSCPERSQPNFRSTCILDFSFLIKLMFSDHMLCDIAAVNSYCFINSERPAWVLLNNFKTLIWAGIFASLAQISVKGFLTRSAKHTGREIRQNMTLIYICTSKKREEEETKWYHIFTCILQILLQDW